MNFTNFLGKLSITVMKLVILIICIIGYSIFSPPPVWPQPPQVSVDRATREVNRPLLEEAEERVAPKPQKPEEEIKEEPEEKKEEGPKFLAKKINLVGTETVSPDEFKGLISKYENKEVRIDDLNILAKEIEREYLRKGIIAACFIPPQDIKQGVVSLRIVEAKMGELQMNDFPFFDKRLVSNYWRIKPGNVLQYNKMSKSLQLMNKNPDKEVTATLHAGKKPETTDVLLNVKTSFPIHGFFSLDNEGSVSTGRFRIGYGVRDNNFLLVDDTLLLGKTFGDHFDGVYVYHTVPITNIGTSIMYGYSDSLSVPKKEYNVYGLSSRSQSVSFFMQQDLYKDAEYLGEASLGMDSNDKVTHTTADGTLTRDRFRTMRIKTNIIHRFPGCITYINPQLSQGLNIFGARSANPLSSRSGKADNNFTKFNLGISHKRMLPLNLQASVKFNCQFASEKLASQEEFSLGGLDSVRGYPSGDFTADWGFSTNFELLVPSFWIPENVKIPYAPESLRDSITGVLFFDQGYGEKLGPQITEQVRDSIASIGLGVRMRFFNQLLLRLEWGFPITPNEPITEDYDGGRLHFSLSIDDQMYKEMERIKKEMYENNIKNTAWRLLDDEIEQPENPLRKRLYAYMYLAQLAQKEGELKKARRYYAEFIKLGDSLYNQSEEYVRSCFAHEKELEEYNELAKKHYKEGDFESAKQLWQKIENEANIKPFVLEMTKI